MSALRHRVEQRCANELTYYRWRKQCGGMGAGQLKELKKLQIGAGEAIDPVNRLPGGTNEQRRRAVADLTLDKQILAQAARGIF